MKKYYIDMVPAGELEFSEHANNELILRATRSCGASANSDDLYALCLRGTTEVAFFCHHDKQLNLFYAYEPGILEVYADTPEECMARSLELLTGEELDTKSIKWR